MQIHSNDSIDLFLKSILVVAFVFLATNLLIFLGYGFY